MVTIFLNLLTLVPLLFMTRSGIIDYLCQAPLTTMVDKILYNFYTLYDNIIVYIIGITVSLGIFFLFLILLLFNNSHFLKFSPFFPQGLLKKGFFAFFFFYSGLDFVLLFILNYNFLFHFVQALGIGGIGFLLLFKGLGLLVDLFLYFFKLSHQFLQLKNLYVYL